MKYSRAMVMFGEGMDSYGTGPSSYERSIRSQKKRAREYADELASEVNSPDFDIKRRKGWRQSAKGSTKSAKVKRAFKYRSTRSKTFLTSLKKAKDNKEKFVLLRVLQDSDTVQTFDVKAFNHIAQVKLMEKPSCSCSFFNRSKKQVETCCHLI